VVLIQWMFCSSTLCTVISLISFEESQSILKLKSKHVQNWDEYNFQEASFLGKQKEKT